MKKFASARLASVVNRPLLPTERSLLLALLAARWVAIAWLGGLLIVGWGDLRRPAVAVGVASAELALCVLATWLFTHAPRGLTMVPFVVVDVVLAAALYTADGAAYATGHVFGTSQNLAGQWPLLATLHAAVVLGPWTAGLAAIPIAASRYLGAAANDVGPMTAKHHVSIFSTVVFLGVAAGVGGTLARLLRRVETEVATGRARDEVARTLHDTVLQTLALVERRTATSDPELAAHARRSDRELRAYLFGAAADAGGSLEARVRQAAEQAAARFDTPTVVNVLEDGCRLSTEQLAAVAAAVGEAVANAAEHAQAQRIVVFAEADRDSLFASVRDDGCGFDPSADCDGHHGVRQSIIGRMTDAFGRAEIDSAPGRGTEVRLWIP